MIDLFKFKVASVILFIKLVYGITSNYEDIFCLWHLMCREDIVNNVYGFRPNKY